MSQEQAPSPEDPKNIDLVKVYQDFELKPDLGLHMTGHYRDNNAPANQNTDAALRSLNSNQQKQFAQSFLAHFENARSPYNNTESYGQVAATLETSSEMIEEQGLFSKPLQAELIEQSDGRQTIMIEGYHKGDDNYRPLLTDHGSKSRIGEMTQSLGIDQWTSKEVPQSLSEETIAGRVVAIYEQPENDAADFVV